MALALGLWKPVGFYGKCWGFLAAMALTPIAQVLVWRLCPEFRMPGWVVALAGSALAIVGLGGWGAFLCSSLDYGRRIRLPSLWLTMHRYTVAGVVFALGAVAFTAGLRMVFLNRVVHPGIRPRRP